MVYYNSEKPYKHLYNLPPDTGVNQARQLPDQAFFFKDKLTKGSLEEVSNPHPFLEVSE